MASSSILAKMALQIGANTTEMKRGLADARQQLSGFKNTLHNFSKGLKAIGGVMAGAFSAKAMFDFAAESARLADVQLKAEAQLRAALKGNEEAFERLTKKASEFQSVSLFGDEQLIPMQALLASMGLAEDQINSTLKAAMDLSAGTGMSLDSAVKNLAKTFGGMTGELGESIPALKNLTQEQLKAGEAIKFVQNAFEGQAEAAAKTGLGPVKQFQNAWGDVREEFGKMLMPAIASVTQGLASLMPKLTEGMQAGKKVIIDVINYFIDLYNESIIFRGAIEGIKLSFKQVWEGVKLFFNLFVNSITSTGKILAYVFSPKNWGAGFGAGLKDLVMEGFGGVVDEVWKYGENTATNFKNAYEGMMRKDKIALISTEDVEVAKQTALMAGQQIGEALKAGMSLQTQAAKGPGELEGITLPGLQEAGLNKFKESIAAYKEGLQSVKDAANETGESITESMRESAESALSGSESFRDAAKRIVNSFISQGIAAVIANTLKAAGIFGPAGVALASLAGVAAKNLFSSAVPKLAQGGLAYGPTLAMVGDNRGAGTNPEVIAPLSKLKDMINFDDSRIVSAIKSMQRVNVNVDLSGVSVSNGYSRQNYLNRKLAFALR